MPLLDHFHPPLHGPRRWEGFHHAWATVIAQQLNQKLPPDYFAEPEISVGPELEIDVATLELPLAVIWIGWLCSLSSQPYRPWPGSRPVSTMVDISRPATNSCEMEVVMVRFIAGLAVALFGVGPVLAGELDGDFASKATQAPTVKNETVTSALDRGLADSPLGHLAGGAVLSKGSE